MEIKGKDNYDVAFTVGGTVVSLTGHNHDHDALTNFVANEHINHGSLSVIAGLGLSGGGTLTTNRTIDLDITELTADASPDGAADYVATYDASGATHKKVLLDDKPGGAADYVATYDASGATHKKVLLDDKPGGGNLTFTEHYSFIPDSSWTDGTWNTVTLSGISGPCIVEILITNENETIDKTGGIREVGSSLNRSRNIDKYTPITLTVNANSSNQVELYAQKKATTDFYLIGEYN